jgi:uncharacterized protein (TIGR03066 family)
MTLLRLMLAGVVLCAVTIAVGADDKKAPDAKLLVGTWELTKDIENGKVPAGSVAEFGKDGKYKFTFKIKGKEVTQDGTYLLADDKLTIKTKDDDVEKKIVYTIKHLNDSECVMETSKGDTIEWKRKKGS